jgi:hypothetical protein
MHDPRAFPGYTLLGPLFSADTYLIDINGRTVQTWNSRHSTVVDSHLLGNGHLLHSAKLPGEELFFTGPGDGGKLQEFSWDGELIWDFKLHNEKQLQHHAITPLPNGHLLLLVWELKSAEEAIAAGHKPEMAKDCWLADSVVEIQPTGKRGAKVVWEWHAWDHAVQDYDRAKANYGDVGAHPELIDINFSDSWRPTAPAMQSIQPQQQQQQEIDRLRTLGYLGSKPAAPGNRGEVPDWLHINAAAYNADLDQIMLCVRAFSEIWIIDHSTSSREAAGHVGGRSGRGGDVLYRWGNSRTYRAGTENDQRLFQQHDAHWIAKGLPGEGHVLIFNNGPGRSGDHYSSVDEIVLPPADAQGSYPLVARKGYGPDQPIWSYTTPRRTDFFAEIMSGAQRLPNGNTLICDGVHAILVEVTPENQFVWNYCSPVASVPWTRAPNGLFRAPRYELNFAGLQGKALVPGKTVEEICPRGGPEN